MKIVICGSMSVSKEMLQIKLDLEKRGHSIILPKDTEKYASEEKKYENRNESTQNKIDDDLIRSYFKIIEKADAVIAANYNKKHQKNYLGGNTFLEIGFAHVLNKKIYLINPIPNISYADEIKAMKPIILNGDLSKIK